MFYTNGGIYKYDTNKLVIIFSAFADEYSILAAPLLPTASPISVPLLVGTELLHVSIYDMFRINKENLSASVALIDADGIEMISESMASGIIGQPTSIPIPVAIMVDNPQSTMSDEIASQVNPSIRRKYTLDDYYFIKDNYMKDTDAVINKYGLKGKQAVYRLRYTLQKRFGEVLQSADHIKQGNSSGEH